MTKPSLKSKDVEHPRLLGSFGNRVEGPCLVVVAGIHGNEPGGVLALSRLFQELEEESGASSRGRLVGLRGNGSALRSGARWVDRDLNRLWTDERVQALRDRSEPPAPDCESREQSGLLGIIEELLDQTPHGRFYLLDLHSTSSDSVPFSIVNDHPATRLLAGRFPVPMVFGLDEEIQGTLARYFDGQGIPALGFEGGQHDAPETVEAHLAIVKLALVFTGVLREADCPGFAAAFQQLEEAAQALPRLVRVRYRHPVRPEDEFRMLPDLCNFQKVTDNQLLASDRGGEIRSPYAGRILMPLYQSQGDDGFFIVDEDPTG